MKRLLLFCLVAVAFVACTKEQLPQADYNIIPQPKEVQLNEEKPFELDFKTLVYYESGLQREAQFLVEYVNDIMGYVLQMQEYQSQPDGIVLKVVPKDFDQAEAYEINITSKQVIIKGADAAGVFYGIQTLRKSLPVIVNSQFSIVNCFNTSLQYTADCQRHWWALTLRSQDLQG